MKTIKFKGESVHALMRQAKEEFGDRVLLLSTRQDAPASVEIEVGLLEADSEADTGADSGVNTEAPDSKEISLNELADLLRDSDALNALTHHGVSAEFLKALRKTSRAKVWTVENTAKALAKVLAFEPHIAEGVKFVALFGPTGSGRTTNIIKLAAKLTTALGLQIGIVAADPTDEEGAYHLCGMGRVLGVPVTGLDFDLPADQRLADAGERLGDCDLIFVDTPSLSRIEEGMTAEVSHLFAGRADVVKLLVVPAVHSESDTLKIIEHGASLGCTRAMLSMLDRSGQVGNVLSAVWKASMPVSFFSTGDEIPDDIEPATPKRLAWYLSRLVH